ncbi:phospholipase D-like domain-containing protein [Cupriavidus sp. H18C1]|uniref:phospholipase D-like domain-containing protein n=1 Tax=Cupriavidus sp. H18C1 TaxID=3241601 RepID=UPI003BB94FEF
MLIHSSGKIEDFLRLNETGCLRCTNILASIPYAMKGVASDDFYKTITATRIPCTTYCRLDWSVPFDTRIIRDFSSEGCKFFFIEEYLHAKVIWWKGWGAYIGSCNLTDRACFENFEAGWFFEDSEINARGIQNELQAFFDELERDSIPESSEIVSLLDRQNERLGEYRAMRQALSHGFSDALHRHLSSRL